MSTKLEDLRALLATNLADRATKEARVDELVAAVETRADKTPTAEEIAELNAVRTAVVTLDADRKTLAGELVAAEARQAARDEAETLALSLPTPPVTTTAGRIQVRSEEKVYRPGAATSFFGDLYARDMNRGDARGAAERLYRHEQEMAVEYRDIGVGAAAGAIPPKYLVDQFAINLRAGRPFLNSLNSQALPPDFVSTVIPRGTAGSLAGVVPEGSGFTEQDIAVTNDTPVVQLIGAQQDVSRTLFERGGYVVDGVIFPDLVAAAELSCNATALKGSNNTTSILGPINVSGITTVAFTTGSPTVALLWPKLANAIGTINNKRFAPATCIYMTPLRWAWITAAVDTQNRPLFNFSTKLADTTTMGLGTSALYGQIVGSIMDIPVVTDASLPQTLTAGVGTAGTEDLILIVRTPDFILWEDPLMRFTFEQTPSTAPGQVRLAAGRFIFAHFGRYPVGISVVSGTGLVAPTF